MTEHEEKDGLGSIAIVGMAGRFPGADSVTELWQKVRDGQELIRFFTDEELIESGVDPAIFNDPNYVRAHGYLEGIDQFDAEFFDINPREADITDPQIRLFLENSWAALEDAGIDPERYPGAIAMFAGCSNNAYVFENLIKNPKMIEAVGYTAAALGNHTDFLATRASYKLDLRGPSVTLQTACSTSLVATHMACQSLLSGESDVALAGGVCVTVLKKQGYMYVEGGTNTDDGHVRAFDAGGDGMLGGNAVAMVVLKRLEDALADGDTIRAVIRGTAINNDGIDKVTFTAPSVNGQAQVILDALEVADVDPRTIECVEAHGTATPLGDPIEIAALTQAWRDKTEDRQFCRIGTLKTNVGHTDIAAGVSGLIKTALQLQHAEIAPSLHYEQPNPEINFEASPFVVNTELFPWAAPKDHPRRAAVSSFGMGGTNAHAVLQEAPTPEPTSESRGVQLYLTSGRNVAALDANTANLADHLEATDQDPADVAFTLQVGRKAFEERRAVVANSREAAVEALRKLDKLHSVTETCTRKDRGVAFLFTGQGAQYPNMMRGLYDSEPVFKAELDRCCDAVAKAVGLDLRTLILPPAGEEEAAGERLALTQYTQPALFCVEYALAQLWLSWGLEPEAMAGHSIGEYVAACLAGVFSLEDALQLVAARGRLIGSLPEGGSMMAVHLTEDELKPQLPQALSIAAINAPGLVVVSGPDAAIAELEAAMEGQDVSTRRLHTSHAFHSVLMEPILEAFGREVAKVTLHAPEQAVVSCATGTWLSDEQATDPRYWVDHVRDAVRFADCVETLVEDPDRVLLEVGPGQTLSSLAQLTLAGRDTIVLSSTRHPREERDDLEVMLLALGRLWAVGVEVDWEEGFYAEEQRRRVPLPTYAFQRQRYWVEPLEDADGAWAGPAKKRLNVGSWFAVPAWERTAPPGPGIGTEPRTSSSSMLVFDDASGLADAIAAQLEGSKVELFRVRAAAAYSAPDEHTYTIDPTSAEDYRTLMGDLRNRGKAPNEILHLGFVDDARDAGAEEERDFYGLMYLAQSLSIIPQDEGLRLLIVTSGMQDVVGGDLTAPEKAVVLGPVKAMTAELDGVICRSVDLGTEELERVDRTARWLVDEVASHSNDLAVAYRGAHRWNMTYHETPLAECEARPEVVREGASVLVTGGLGGVGLALSEYLAEHAQAKLTLVGRSALPERGAWDAWISEHGEDDSTSKKIAKVRRLEELGAEVLTVAGDVNDAASIRAAAEAAVAKFGAVHGVVHAAGVAGSGILELKTRDIASKVLAPKLVGTRNLEAALADQALDFVVLCSSISSAILDVGQIDYTSANAYLDAFATHRSAAGTNVIAINWDAWQEVGMAVETEIPAAMRAARDANLRLGIAPSEGRDAFARILASGLSQVVVSPRDLLRRIEEHKEGLLGSAPAEEELVAEATVAKRATHARPSLSTEYQAPQSDTETKIAEVWADLLGIDKVGTQDNFFELGGNSLVMMQLNVRLRSLFGISLPVRALFETPDVGAVSERIDTLLVLSAEPEDDDAREETEEFTL